MPIFRTLTDIVRKVVIVGCIGYTAQDWIATPWYLEEGSMVPTLKPKQVVMTNPWSKELSRGDIVIVKVP